jgi:uncharacterized protein (TIGR00645 family)
MQKKPPSLIEKIFESMLWKSRLIVLIAVIFSIIAAFALFLTGSFEIWHTVTHIITTTEAEPDYSKLLIGVIGAVDLYLIGIVLLIFAFGIYELFVSQIDDARTDKDHSILEITSLDELKTKLLKVIIMVLIVSFFKVVLSAHFTTPLEILYFAIAILAVASCSFFLHHVERDK